jgi:hypothetical protein
MSLTNSTSTSFVQILYPTQSSGGANGTDAIPGNSVTDLTGLFRAASDGDRQALMKICGGLGGPDYIFTGNTAGAETVNFSVSFANLLKLYAAQVSGVTRLAITARVHCRSAAVATSGYWQVTQVFDDISGTMTALGTQAVDEWIEGAATTDPALTNSGSNTLQVAVTSLAAAAVRVELFVDHVA